MSTAVHNLVKDVKLHNIDPEIEGNFPLDVAVIESETSKIAPYP